MSDNSLIRFSDGTQLPSRVLPAPMEGVTGGAWLKVLTKRQYVTCWWTPFLRISTAVPRKSKLASWLEPFLATGLPVIAQLMGTDSALLAQAGKLLHELGASVIDLNCACPSPAVLSSHAGGYCLRNPQWIKETLEDMREALGTAPLSVKLRMGYASPNEFERYIAPAIATLSVDMATVHFRSVTEKYEVIPDGLARMRRIRRVLPDHFLVGCGDIWNYHDAIAMRETGVDAIACARGMLKNPRLIQDIQANSVRPFSTDEAMDFLAELSAEEAPHSFILQMAANFFGKDSNEFRKILSLNS